LVISAVQSLVYQSIQLVLLAEAGLFLRLVLQNIDLVLGSGHFAMVWLEVVQKFVQSKEAS
jgi:hypothetical protein